jgi:hypothetical protein
MAEIYKPLEFGKRERKREGIEALDEAKVFDQFRDENTLTNLYRTQEEALAGGDIDTSRKIQKQIDAIINKEPLSDFADGGRVEMASGGIAVLKSLLNFLAKGRGKKGSQLLREVNPKKFGTILENLMLPEDKKMIKRFRVEYLESLLDTIRTDKAMLDKMKTMPIDQREAFFNMINQGMNRGRLDVYKTIDPDEAILEIEQMIKNLKFKDVPEQEIKRQMNADGGRVGLMAGGVPKIKQMIDFILKHGDKVSKVGGKISKEFLEFMAEKNPQNIKNVYLDVVKRLGMGIDVGKAPKTNLKKVRSRVEADKRITKELADENQIPVKKYKKGDPITSENFGETGFAPDTTDLQKARQIEVNENTASDMAEFMRREDPEGFQKIQDIVDNINQRRELEAFDVSKRKPNANGGLATLFKERG